MTKSELIAEIANRTDLAKTDVEKTLKAFEDVAHEVVAKGDEKLTLPGFLSFEQVPRSARTARNPQTGEPIQVPASKAVKVSAGSKLKAVGQGRQVAPPVPAGPISKEGRGAPWRSPCRARPTPDDTPAPPRGPDAG